MKTTIASILMRNAIDYVKRSKTANFETDLQQEVGCSIGAHLMLALTIEAIGNEIGQTNVTDWDKFEKTDTVAKWHQISGLGGHLPFELGKEPLQTVKRLMSIRNLIAHPKVEDLGDGVIIRSSGGDIKRKVSKNHILQGGDKILLGFEKLIDRYDSSKSIEIAKKSIQAIKKLRAHLAITGFKWLEGFEKELGDL
ncbi:MAG: hypothetical protein Q8K02_03240 [Flavobacterium sp.]|nr:hypothetical protein [Flavobacterium sp.]